MLCSLNCWATGDFQSMPFTSGRLMSTLTTATSARCACNFTSGSLYVWHGGQYLLVKSKIVVLPGSTSVARSTGAPWEIWAGSAPLVPANAAVDRASETNRAARVFMGGVGELRIKHYSIRQGCQFVFVGQSRRSLHASPGSSGGFAPPTSTKPAGPTG